MAESDREREEAHAELARERWGAHEEKHAAEKELDATHREAHREQHASIARNLSEYKTQSNEWRASLNDLRNSYFPIASHEAFEKEMRAALDGLNRRIDTEREERRDQQNLRVGRTAGISQSAAIILGLLAAGGTIVGITATLLAIFKP